MVFQFPTPDDEENDSDDAEATLELPVVDDRIAVIGPGSKRGRPSKTPTNRGGARRSKSDAEQNSTPLLRTAGTSNLRLLPKVFDSRYKLQYLNNKIQLKSRHIESIEQRMRDIKAAYSNREWLPKTAAINSNC